MNEHLNMLSAKIERFSPVVNTGRAYNDGSRHHASANKEYFTSASSAQWQCGAGDFEIGRWVRFDTVSSQDLINKGSEYSLEVLTNKFRFGTYAGGSWTYVTANTFGALSANTWYFVRAWRQSSADTSNMLTNPNFETGDLTGWDVYTTYNGTVTASTTLKHSGTYSAKFTGNNNTFLRQTVTVIPGHTYNISAWLSNNYEYQTFFYAYDMTHSAHIINRQGMALVSSATFRQFTQSFTAPAGCTSVRIGFSFEVNPMTIYIDDVSMVEEGTINISVNNGTADSVSATAPTAGSGAVSVGKGSAGFYNGRWDSQYVTHRLSTAAEALISYNGGNGQTGLLMSTANASRFVDIDIWHDGNEADGTAYDIIGTNHLTATADPIIAPPVYGSELIVNGGFETAGGGGSDVFGTWAETAGDGAIADETTIVRSGGHALKFTRGTNAQNVYQTIAVTAGASYYLSFWSRGDGTNEGRCVVNNASDLSGILGTGTGNITTSWKLFTINFTAPAGCTAVNVYLSNTVANGGIAYFDDVSIKQITTPSINNGGFDLRPATCGEKTNVSTVSRSRTSNVATMVATAHGLKNNDVVNIAGMTDTSFNGTGKTVTVVDVDTFTYASTGTDAGSAGDTGGRIATDVFSGWSENVAGASMVVAGTATPYAGAYNARMDVDASGVSVSIRSTLLIANKKYTASFAAKASSACSIYYGDSATIQKKQDLTTNYTEYTGNFTATNAEFAILRDIVTSASKSIYIDQVTLTSNGPTSDAGIASGLALNTNGVSKVINDGWNAGSFAQITLAKRPLFSTAYFGGCLLFDGVDDGLVATGDKIGVGDVTICAVIRPTGWGGGNFGRIINNGQFNISLNNTNGYLQVLSDNAASTNSANSSISLNTSYIVTVTRTSAGVANIYINGALSGSANQNSGTPVAGSDTYIGNRVSGDRAFSGYIGKFGVINRILSVGEIMAMSRWMSIMSGGIF